MQEICKYPTLQAEPEMEELISFPFNSGDKKFDGLTRCGNF